ncbi:hypothetical protein SAMN06297164_3633 [Nitrosomonas ureae]|uniref:Uncharacterized protein n=1 Tax=Nitrosomonas ureae TaxID=44577 RepID=A0A286AM24_9PROT|nr:hypothetical protein SAMN06297164_3633 [Nitrosomonas ureae]
MVYRNNLVFLIEGAVYVNLHHINLDLLIAFIESALF